jgi:hypothetical protein
MSAGQPKEGASQGGGGGTDSAVVGGGSGDGDVGGRDKALAAAADAGDMEGLMAMLGDAVPEVQGKPPTPHPPPPPGSVAHRRADLRRL